MGGGGGVSTQVSPEAFVSGTAAEEIRHEPMTFLSVQFNGSQLLWPTVYKEAFATVCGLPQGGVHAARRGCYHFERPPQFGTICFSTTVLMAELSNTTAQRLLH